MAPQLFVLGREPDLSAAELHSFLGAEGLQATDFRRLGGVVRIDWSTPPDPRETIRGLGGTVRIAELRAVLGPEASDGELENALLEEFRQRSRALERKLVFALGLVNPPSSRDGEWMHPFSSRIKEKLREEGISSRFVPPARGVLPSSAQVTQNQLMSRGGEYLICFGREEILLGETCAVQEFEEDAQRDMEKPERRMREGLLPPKIARIMVNLARRGSSGTLLDPFCGSGVVLMEALDRGLEPVGVDRDGDAVAAATKNVRWLAERAGAALPVPLRITRGDARNLSDLYRPLSMDAVATEPYLGPPLRRLLSLDEARVQARSLRELYIRALAEIRIVLKPGARCVFVTPIFRTRDGKRVEVDIRKDIPFIGFQDAAEEGIGGSFVHRRSSQKVERRIHVLRSAAS